MILIDTNVVSEPMKPQPDRAVVEWLDRQNPATLYLSSTSLAELLFGIELLAPGKRRDEFETGLKDLLARFFGPRILPFDEQAALSFAPLVCKARAVGRTISMADGQIAAVAAVQGFMVASRDTTPFVAAGLRVINPWHLKQT